MSMNYVIVYGNLGQDPELRYTQNQTPVASFSLATQEKYKEETQTEWHKIVVWGKTAENCSKFLKKGSSAIIEGKLQTRKWEDKNGTTHYTTEIVARNVQFTGSRKDQEKQETGELSVPF